MPIDTSNLESLLAANKMEEARVVIEAAIDDKMTDLEKGAATVDMAAAFMDISNGIGQQYKAALEVAIAGMRKINASHSTETEKAQLAKVRADLGKI